MDDTKHHVVNDENDTKDISEVLEWDEHYTARKKTWRLNEVHEDVTSSLE